MRMLKLYAITLLVLEVIAIAVHFDELLTYTGSVISSCIPLFIMAAVIIWMIKQFFK